MQEKEMIYKPFGRIRNLLWPIYSFEIKKLAPMFTLFFLISFVYNILRNLKVSLFVGGSDSFSGLMPFLKVGAVLPGALLFTYIFTKLMSRFNREKVFYIIISGFLVYFAIFLFVLYPHSQQLQLNGLADLLQSTVFSSPGFNGVVSAIRHLNLTVFYVMCEMWSVVVLSMLFWGFANEVTKVHEAKRFYAIFALGANSSGILSGTFGQLESLSLLPVTSFYKNHQWIFLQLCTVLLIGGVIMSIFYWLNNSVFKKEHKQVTSGPVKKREKLSLGECFQYLRKSRYLTYLVVIVVCYNIVYNLTDNMWVYKIEQVYPTKREFNAYMNTITSITGYVAVILAMLVSGNVIRRFGWTVAALITPLVWLIAGTGFFTGLLFENTIVLEVLSGLISNPANLVLLLGSIQISLGRGCKYTVFDEAKEIAFIPLPKASQRKGKAVVDGLASRFGKSGGSIIIIALLGVFGSTANTIPYVSVIIMLALAAWLYATIKMGIIVDKATSDENITLTLEEEQILAEESNQQSSSEPVAQTN